MQWRDGPCHRYYDRYERWKPYSIAYENQDTAAYILRTSTF
jgi:hypothetical protein